MQTTLLRNILYLVSLPPTRTQIEMGRKNAALCEKFIKCEELAETYRKSDPFKEQIDGDRAGDEL